MKILLLVLLLLVGANGAEAHQGETDLNTVVVKASRSKDTVGQMNKNVYIITAEDIINSTARNLPELLNTVPGVHATVNSSIKDQKIDMGGFGEWSMTNVLVLIDGRRLNVPDLSAADLSVIDLNTIDHVEVIQGAGTVLYGDSASGGVINIITKKGNVSTKPSVTLGMEIGSYKTHKQTLALSGGLSRLGYHLNYARQQSNNYRTNNNYWANDYDARLNYEATDIFGIDFAQGYHLDRYRLPGGISVNEINTKGPTGVNPSRTAYGTTSDSHFDVTPRLQFEHGTSKGEFSVFTSARRRLTNFVQPSFGGTDYRTDSYEIQPKVIVSSVWTDRLDNKMTAGYDYIYAGQKRRSSSPGNLQDKVFATQSSHSVYLLEELTLDDRCLLNTGVRKGWATYIFDQKEQNSIKFDRSENVRGYEGGIGYKYNQDSKVYANYTRSYRLPVLDEFFQSPYAISGTNYPAQINQGLTHQVGNQYQLGVRDNSIKNVHLGSSITTVQYKNEIYGDPNIGNTNYSARTRHYSEQFDVEVDLFNKRVRPFANITFQQSKFVDGPYSENRIPDVPDQLAHAGIAFQPIESLSTTFSTTLVGERFGIGDEGNTEDKVKRYTTIDWGTRYQYKNWELWVTLNNILDTEHMVYGSSFGAIFGGTQIFYPGPGRNVQAGVKVRF